MTRAHASSLRSSGLIWHRRRKRSTSSRVRKCRRLHSITEPPRRMSRIRSSSLSAISWTGRTGRSGNVGSKRFAFTGLEGKREVDRFALNFMPGEGPRLDQSPNAAGQRSALKLVPLTRHVARLPIGMDLPAHYHPARQVGVTFSLLADTAENGWLVLHYHRHDVALPKRVRQIRARTARS